MSNTNKEFKGTFAKVSIHIDEMNLDINNMGLSQLNLMCGTNGVGKSFLNKSTWAMLFFANAICLRTMYPEYGDFNPEFTDDELMQFIMDNTFSDQDFTGTMRFYNEEPILGTPEEYVDVTFNEGKVTVTYDMLGSTNVGTPTYMATSTRKFSALDNYLMIKNLQGIDTISTFKDIETMCKSFKLYEILAIEKVLASLYKVSEVLTKLREISGPLADELPNINTMYIKDNKIQGDVDGKVKTISTLADGHQALLMMFITQLG